MAKSSLERALEKQRREAKKAADQEARRQRATAIVTGQPLIGGMRIMDAASEEILQIMLSTFDGNTDRRVFGSFSCFPAAYQNSLLLEFEKLSMYGVVSSPHADLGGFWEATLTPQGITYFDDKAVALEKEKSMQNGVNIGSIQANGSNIIIGDAVNSTFSVDNSFTRIQKQIEEHGGEDKKELNELLEEVKGLLENIQESRHIPKNKNLFSKLSDHLEKHGWFYGEVVGLLGGTALKMLQG